MWEIRGVYLKKEGDRKIVMVELIDYENYKCITTDMKHLPAGMDWKAEVEKWLSGMKTVLESQ